jgi:hypothetical protein
MLRQQSRLRAVIAANAVTIESRRHALTVQHHRIMTVDSTRGTVADWSRSLMYLPAPRVDSTLPPSPFRVAAAQSVRFPAPDAMTPSLRRRG